MDQSIKSDGIELISKPYDSEDSSEKVLTNVKKTDFMTGHVCMQEAMKILREHSTRKKEVLQTSMNNKNDVHMNTSDVDIDDLIKVAYLN